MIMDIFVSLIFVLSTASGFHHGFLRSLIHAMGWILSILLGLLFHSFLYGFIKKNTGFYSIVYEKIALRFTPDEPQNVNSFLSDMPVIIRDLIEPLNSSLTTAIVSGISDFLFKLITLIAIVIIVRLAFLILTAIFGKSRKRRNFFGLIDGLLGFVGGMVKGLLLIFLLLALIVPMIGLCSFDSIRLSLESSRIAIILYDNNYLLLAVKGIFL